MTRARKTHAISPRKPERAACGRILAKQPPESKAFPAGDSRVTCEQCLWLTKPRRQPKD